jgi:SAM-dependent methyltransferase
MASAFWDAVYALGATPWDTGIVPPEVRGLVEDGPVRPPGRVLDVGCGTGTNVVYFAEQGFEAVGVDVSRLAVRRATGRIAKTGVDAGCFVHDVTRLHLADGPVRGPFDAILDIGCFHGLGDEGRRAYVDMVGAMLAPGGHLLQYVHMSGGVSVSGSGRRPIAGWRRLAIALIRTVLRPSRPPRPDRAAVEGALGGVCRLEWVREGEEAGRRSAWFLWRRHQGGAARAGDDAGDRGGRAPPD